MSHTPGPWQVKRLQLAIKSKPFGEAFIYINTARTPTDSHVVIMPRITEGEQEANARLIAAAPELLAALRYVAENYPIASTIVEEAIAHAEGRA